MVKLSMGAETISAGTVIREIGRESNRARPLAGTVRTSNQYLPGKRLNSKAPVSVSSTVLPLPDSVDPYSESRTYHATAMRSIGP